MLDFLKKAWVWCQCYWFVPLAIAGVALLAILAIVTRRKDGPQVGTIIESAGKELEVIEAGAEVRRTKAELGHEQAKQLVEQKYAVQKAQLDADQAKEAKALEDDPIALAKYLVRAGAAKS